MKVKAHQCVPTAVSTFDEVMIVGNAAANALAQAPCTPRSVRERREWPRARKPWRTARLA